MGSKGRQITGMDVNKDRDMVPCDLALTILEQALEHEEDRQSLKGALELLASRGAS